MDEARREDADELDEADGKQCQACHLITAIDDDERRSQPKKSQAILDNLAPDRHINMCHEGCGEFKCSNSIIQNERYL